MACIYRRLGNGHLLIPYIYKLASKKTQPLNIGTERRAKREETSIGKGKICLNRFVLPGWMLFQKAVLENGSWKGRGSLY